MARVVILGAGLTGLSTAYHLEQQGFTDVKIFERNTDVGGLCQSVTDNGFTYDYTGHLIHISDPYFKEFVDHMCGLSAFNFIARRSFIYSHDTYTHYPFQTNLYGLSPNIIADCIEGFVKRKKHIRHPKSFYDWVLKHFGRGIGKHFLFSYQQKIFSYDLKKVRASWTGRFVPSTTLRDIVKGSVAPPQKTVGYNKHFYYPKKGGIQFLPNSIAEHITTPVYTEHEMSSLNLAHKTITFTNGHVEPYDMLVTTVPLNNLLARIVDAPHTQLNPAHAKLICNSVINFNLGFDVPSLSHKHWIYFPEKKYAFYRIGFWNNFTQHATPPNCSAIYGEFSYLPGKTSRTKRENILSSSIDQTVNLLGVSHKNIISKKVLTLNHAYVIYDDWREKNIEQLHQALNFESIFSTGRFGGWKYSSMQEAILDGKKIAEHIVHGRSKHFYGAIKTSEYDTPHVPSPTTETSTK